jgi:deazaflavin-dependent oxidoreductase (nitroreductase family)
MLMNESTDHNSPDGTSDTGDDQPTGDDRPTAGDQPTTAGDQPTGDLGTRYIRPAGRFDRFFNRTIHWLARHGVSLLGTHEIRVVGRTSGQVRTAVINVLKVDGRRYLVAPRGHTQWVRNLRAAGGAGELRVGRRVEAFQARELADEAKPPIIHAYLDKWSWEVGRFFDNLTKDSSEEEIAAVAPGFPVFALDGTG